MDKKRLFILGGIVSSFFLIFILFLFLTWPKTQPTPKEITKVLQPSPTEIPTVIPSPTIDPIAGWKTYTNTKYGYSTKYPKKDWEYLEVPNQTYQSMIDQTWFSNVGWPPPQTGARAPIVIDYAEENPEIHYQPEFFENYKKENITIGDSLSAVRISGYNKEGLVNETIVILPVRGESYNFISFLPWSGQGENQDFDAVFNLMLSSFKFLD